MSGDLVELTRGRRLASVLCRLSRSGFTGLVYAEHDDGSLAISIRDGRPMFVEDLGEQQSTADALLEQGLVSKEQYAAIATRVLESQADNEDIAFCQVAVEMSVLSQAQVDAEFERRIRGCLIRAAEWEQCRIEIDDDPDSVTGLLEYPQDVGALIYMGVRTFFDDERVRALVGSEPVQYARLVRPIAEVLDFFQLESDEAALLAHVHPDVQLGPMIEEKAVDSLDAWQLVCMLVLAEMIELQPTPFAPSAERSGVRTARGAEAPVTRREPAAAARDPRAGMGSQARMPVVREESAGRGSQARMPAMREESAGRGSQARMPAAREEPAMPASRARAPLRREDDDARPGAADRSAALREEYVGRGSRPRMPVAREEPATSGSRPRMPVAREEPATPGSRPRMPVAREESAGSRPRMPVAREERAAPPAGTRAPVAADRAPAAASAAARRPPAVAERAAGPQHGGAHAAARAQSVPEQAAPSATASAATPGPAPASRPRRRPIRKLSTALQRLDRELKQVRTQQSTPQPAAQTAPAAAAAEAGHGRAHVEQLLRMRATAMAQKPAAAQPTKAVEEFKLAQEALRDQQFGRAYEHLRKACESEPENEVYSMFCMWASFRANSLKEDGINKLRTLLRARVSDDEHKAFAYYALGHISLAEKRDDLAEKFFRKAIELDKQNKDAERHLRIIELRRKTAASEQRANKIFGIEIGIKKS